MCRFIHAHIQRKCCLPVRILRCFIFAGLSRKTVSHLPNSRNRTDTEMKLFVQLEREINGIENFNSSIIHPWAELRVFFQQRPTEIDLRQILSKALIVYETPTKNRKCMKQITNRMKVINDEKLYQRMIPHFCRSSFDGDRKSLSADLKFIRTCLMLMVNVLFSAIAIFYIAWTILEKVLTQLEWVRRFNVFLSFY